MRLHILIWSIITVLVFGVIPIIILLPLWVPTAWIVLSALYFIVVAWSEAGNRI